MPRSTYPPDSFDDLPDDADRVGAHRAENPRLRTGLIVAWAALAAVVLIAAGIFGTLLTTGRLGSQSTPPPTAAATPTITPVVDTAYSVLVLNATGEPGKATAVADQIVKAGFSRGKVSPGEAASTYPTTTVYYVLPQDAAAAAGLANIIGGAAIAQSDEYQPAGDPEAQQLAVVLGTDRASSPAPSPSKTS
ncbi:LytR C-terminal domain-containing protein [Microbacterium luticocti]|uniref:LytR C-terminal domain-containing protein n=1 Tax=Microbacterium luticocti TaxID=451764 RepID=UPI0004217DDF|nr:LytR C-terminal domain-containing protein [Microbacterium luticocti]